MLGTSKSTSKKVMNGNGHDDLMSLREDIECLRRDLSSLAGKALDTSAESVSRLKGIAEDEIVKLRDYGTAGLKKAEDTVRDKPGQSMAVAFLAGIIINALLFKK